VALTEAKIKDLEDKKFDKLYEEREDEWTALAKTARDFARKNITNGKDPRPDDIAEALRPMLRVNDAVRAHQEDNKARAKRYLDWFVEYVIDQALLS
jgi:hypothetical protein